MATMLNIFIENKPEQAYLLLAERNYASAKKEVITVSVDDKPGNLQRMSGPLTDSSVNVVNAFGFVCEASGKGVCCLEVDQPKDLTQALEAQGFTVLPDGAFSE